MSTRSRIAIVVKDEDLKKFFTANPELLPHKLDLSENDGEVEYHKTEIENKVISIYHHWDGYLNGVGETLLAEYDSYEKVLNLMLFGDASTICEGDNVRFYNSWRGEPKEPWEHVKPCQSTDIPELVKMFKSSDQEYLYIYIPDSNGNYDWYFTERFGEDAGRIRNLNAEINGTQAEQDAPILNGNEIVTRTEAKVEVVQKMYVLICQVGETMTTEAVSSDEDKLKALMLRNLKCRL